MRPKKPRKINFKPEITYFIPKGVSTIGLEEISLEADELECLRLKYVEGLDQIDGAKLMNVSQSTFQRALDRANRKVANALIYGLAIRLKEKKEKVSIIAP